MLKAKGKFASALLSVTTATWLVGASALMPVANAQSVADLQAQIQSLLALIAQLQAQIQGGGSTGGSTGSNCGFTRDLTMGSTGADVTCLQDYLTGTGHFSFAGGSTGYFGSVTQSAVAAWQAANGVSPAVGYFGPISRAKYNALVASLPPVVPPVVPPGVVPPVTPPSACTGEGSFTASLAATPAANPSAYAGENVPVFGVEIKAQVSDVTIDRADLQLSVTNVGATTTYAPESFIKRVRVWDGSTEIGSLTLDSSTVNFDSSSRYWVRLSGFKFMVPKDAKKVLTFSIDTITTIDNNRVVTVQDYAGASNSIKGVDCMGTASYVDLASTDTRAHTFQSGGASVLTLSTDTNNPLARNVYLDGTDGAKKVELLRFTAKSTSGASTLVTLAVSSTYTSVQPSTLSLYDGDTLLASASTSNHTAFNNIELEIPDGVTKTLSVTADFPATGNGMVASVSIPAAAGNSSYRKADRTTATPTAASALSGRDVHALRKAAILTFVSATNAKTEKVLSTGGAVTASSTMDGTIVFKVKAMGGTLTLPTSGSVLIGVVSDTASTIAVTAHDVAVNTSTDIPDGSEATVTVTARRSSTGIAAADAQVNGYYHFILDDFTATFGTDVFVQNYGLGDFKTPNIFLP